MRNYLIEDLELMSLYIKNGDTNEEISKKMDIDIKDIEEALNIVDNRYEKKMNMLYALTGMIYSVSILSGITVFIYKICNYE
jgi:hypothetical protein